MTRIHTKSRPSLAVAVIGPVPPPIGGMALQAQVLCDHLERDGVNAVLLATNPRSSKKLFALKGLRTGYQAVVFCWRMLKALPRVDIVHVLAASNVYFFVRVIPALLLARLAGRRVIVNYRGGEAAKFLGRYGWVARPVLRLAHCRTVPSTYLASCFDSHGLSSIIVRNIIELERFTFRQRDNLRPRLLVTRNLEPMYNVEMALAAFQIVKQEYPDARLDILGAGSQESSLKNWVSDRRLADVFFHGMVANSQIPAFLDRADILLNPTNVDNLPMSLLEAFASGLPAVSTNVGGVPDLIGDSDAALLVPPGDAEAMAKGVRDLLTQPDRARGLALRARRVAEGYTWKIVRDQLYAVYSPGNGGGLVPKCVGNIQI